MKEDVIEVQGKVLVALRDAKFEVQLDDSEIVIMCHISGKMRKNYINVLPGDTVTVIISPYDVTKGRITFRTKG